METAERMGKWTCSSITGSMTAVRMYNLRNTVINVVNHRETNLVVTVLLIFIATYFIFLAGLGRSFLHPLAPPDNNGTTTSKTNYAQSVMSFAVLWLVSLICARIVTYASLPPLIGILLTGIAFRNIPFINEAFTINTYVVQFLRRTAFTVVLVRAAMGFRTDLFSKANGAVGRLGVVSTICEACAIVLAAHFIFWMRIDQAILFGWVLAAVGSAIVLPLMGKIEKRAYGLDSELPSVVIGSASIDNLLCICAFHVTLTIAFTLVDIQYEIGIMILQIAVGLIVGLVLGFIVWWFPRSDLRYAHLLRCAILLCVSLAFVLGTKAASIECTGIFVTAVLTIVAFSRWRIDNDQKVHYEAEMFRMIWNLYAMPIMFSLAGYDFAFHLLEIDAVLKGLAILGIGLLIRLIAVFILSFYATFNFTEQLFLCLCFTSKATLLAALPSHIVTACADKSCKSSAILIMNACTFAVLLCASFSHMVIQYVGPLVLSAKNRQKINISGESNMKQAYISDLPLPERYVESAMERQGVRRTNYECGRF